MNKKMMEFKTPYLDAIQQVPGKTPGEKYKFLNKISRQTIGYKEAPGDFSSGITGDFASGISYGFNIPAPLLPIVQFEASKLSKKQEEIIAALKSDDPNIVQRALKVEWIFDGSVKSITNFDYFETHIFPEVSLNTRFQIIKHLSLKLFRNNEFSLGQEFFEGVKKIYNLKQAIPLLAACDKDYIWNFIKNGDILLPKKVVKLLFIKFPELVIIYLKFGKPNAQKERVVETVSIIDHLDILHQLIKNYTDDFIDIISAFSYPLGIKIGENSTDDFLKKKGYEILLDVPHIYLSMLSLETISRRLNREQFAILLRKLFPLEMKHFNFDRIVDYLKFQPENLKLPLIMETFKDLYGVELTAVLNKITPQLMLMLSVKDRVNIARQKLPELSTWYLVDCKKSWVCYLTTEESIPMLKDKISNTKDIEERASYVEQLIYSCKVNNNSQDLLHVLEYISIRHRNEIPVFWFRIYSALLKHYKLELLDAENWKILNEMLQRSYVKDLYQQRPVIFESILEKSIHYRLLNELSIEDVMMRLTELKIKGYNSRFNIITEEPKFEKLCLEKFIEIIPVHFEKSKIWESNRMDTVQYLVRAIYDYNKGISNKSPKTLPSDNLSLTNYPWLFENVKRILFDDNPGTYSYKVENIKENLRMNERQLFNSLLPIEETLPHVHENEGLIFLRKEPEKVLENWELIFANCKNHSHEGLTQKFIRKCLWYQEIPVKFINKCLQEIQTDEADKSTMTILALLTRGPEFAKIVEPFIPISEMMQVEGETAKESYRFMSLIPSAINKVNSPPPLQLVENFCQGDYLSLGLVSLTNVSRRTPVNKVIPFAKNLSDKRVSLKKHGIRLMASLCSTPALSEFLAHMWYIEKHKSIREVVFSEVHKLFINQPQQYSWQTMRYCIEGLTANDTESFNVLKEIDKIPNQFIKDYFEVALGKIEKLVQEDLDRSLANELIMSFLRKASPEVCSFFSELYCHTLVEKYAFDLSLDQDLLNTGRLFAVHTFLIEGGDKIESRLKYFCQLLTKTIIDNWNKTDMKNSRFYPMRQWFHEMIHDIVVTDILVKIDPSITKSLLNLFSTVLKPVQDIDSFLQLYFMIQLRNAEFNGETFGVMIQNQLENLIKLFTAELIVIIGESLAIFVDSFKKDHKFFESLMQSLANGKTIYSLIIAAILLENYHKKISDETYKDTVMKLQKKNHPAITTILNKHIISLKLDDVFVSTI